MHKNLSLLIVTILATFLSLTHTSTSSQLECTFKSSPWSIYDSDRLVLNQTETIRYCEVKNKELFVNFVQVEGCSDGTEDLSLVTGFLFKQATMSFFPHGVDRLFKSLIAIHVEDAKLREIHVEDLAGFRNLKILYLNSNELKVIEADLFKFNEKLEFVRLDFNQISHVDPKVFDHLNLKLLALKENSCTLSNAVGENVKNLVKTIKDESCISYEDLEATLTGHERILRILNSKNFDDPKVAELEVKVKEISTEKENLEAKVREISSENQKLTLQVEKLANLDCDTEELEASLQSCQSNLEIKSQEISRLQKIIEQHENSQTSNKIPWKEILIPSVIGLLTLITLIIGIIVIVVKINFIIQKLKDQFYQTTRRPLNVPNDFWHHEE